MLPITRQKKMLGLHNEIFLHTNYIKGASESYALKLISSYKGNRKDLINSTDNDGKTLLHHFIEGYLSTLISIQLILSKKKDAKEILRKKTDEANFYLASVFGLNNIYSLQELGAFDAKDNQNNTPIGMVVNFIRAYDIANKFIYYGGKHRLIDKKHPRLGFSRVFRPHSDFEFSNNAIEQLLIYMGINVKSEYLIKLSELLPTQDIDNIPAELYEHLWKYKPNCSAEFVNMLRYEHVKNILEGNKETLSKLQALSFKEGHHSPVVEAIIHILKKKHIPALQSAAKKGFVEKQWFDLIEKEGRQLPSNITRKSMTETIEQADISGLIKLLNTDFTRIILENFDLELRVREGLNNFSDTDFDVLAEAILAQIKANEGKNELLRKLTKLDNKIKEGSQALFSYIEQYTTANENKDKLRKLLSDNKEIIGFLSIANHFIKQVTVRLKKTMPELLQEVNKYNLYQLIIAIYREDIFTIDRIYKNEAIDINSKLDNSAYGLALNLYRQKYSVSRDSRSYDTNKNIKNLTDKFDQKLLEACEIGTDIIKEFCQKASTNIVPLDPSQFMTPLFYAVIAGKISIAAMLARKYGASIKPVDDCLIIPQHFAAFVGEVKMLEALSKQYDTGFNIGDKELRTPLHFAALGYGRSLFAELEKFKTISIEELKKADGHGQTFFHYAAKSGELPMTTTILTKLISLGKADEIVNLTDNEGRTPFHYLVLSELPKKYEQEKVEEAIDLFISAGADINAKDNEGRTAADLAKEKGYEDINRLIHENITKQSAMAAITESLTKEFLAAVEGNKLQQAEEVLKKCENGKQREAVLNSKNDTGDTALYLACKNENEKLLKLLLSSGADPNITSEYNNTALHIAVQKNQEAMVEALLAHNINVDTKNILGYTALHYAAQLGRDKIASILVKHKADVNARALYGDRPLHYAAEKGHSNLVRILISLGAEPDGKNDFGQTALHYAAENGNVEIAIILLTANPKLILEKDVRKLPALRYAIAKGHKEMVQILLNAYKDFGAKIKDDPLPTDLHWAAKNGHEEIIGCLLKAGLDVNAPDEEGNTALHCAVIGGHLKVVQVLLGTQANPFIENKEGHTALYYAIKEGHQEIVNIFAQKNLTNVNHLFAAAKTGVPKTVSCLLKTGLDINSQDEQGNTLLHIAAKNGSIGLLEFLLDLNIKINVKNKEGKTALQVAVEAMQNEATSILLKKHPEINKNDYNSKLLFKMVEWNRPYMVEFLLSKVGIDVNNTRTEEEGDTALHIAFKKYKYSMRRVSDLINVLLKHGSDIKAKNNSGQTAVDIINKNDILKAAALGEIGIMTVLRNANSNINFRDGQGRSALDWAIIGDTLHFDYVLSGYNRNYASCAELLFSKEEFAFAASSCDNMIKFIKNSFKSFNKEQLTEEQIDDWFRGFFDSLSKQGYFAAMKSNDYQQLCSDINKVDPRCNNYINKEKEQDSFEELMKKALECMSTAEHKRTHREPEVILESMEMRTASDFDLLKQEIEDLTGQRVEYSYAYHLIVNVGGCKLDTIPKWMKQYHDEFIDARNKLISDKKVNEGSPEYEMQCRTIFKDQMQRLSREKFPQIIDKTATAHSEYTKTRSDDNNNNNRDFDLPLR